MSAFGERAVFVPVEGMTQGLGSAMAAGLAVGAGRQAV